jgi:CDP-diacylglycerol--serine O-phosphatidyltransferase
MFALKFKTTNWSANKVPFIFAALVLLLLMLMREAAVSLIIVLYVLTNIVLNQLKTKQA